METEQCLERFHWEASQDKSHEYYVCEPVNEVEFKDLVNYIRKQGYVVTIQGIPFVCFDIGEYLYWTAWDSIENINLINRMLI